MVRRDKANNHTEASGGGRCDHRRNIRVQRRPRTRRAVRSVPNRELMLSRELRGRMQDNGMYSRGRLPRSGLNRQ